MEVQCSKCKRVLSNENINVSKDTAYCDSCGELTSLSSLNTNTIDSKFNIEDPVKGTNYSENIGVWKIEASHRSLYAIFIVPFTCVWAGGSLTGIYGTQLISGDFNLVNSLFGVPFLLGSIILVSISLMSLFGRTIISNDNGRTLIFIGVGPIGWYRRFEWSSISNVVEKQSNQNKHISLEGKKRLSLGWGLNDKKRYYLVNALRLKLSK
jgi:hypothetical protein